MRIFYSDTFVLPLPAGHRFPMEKYALLRRRVSESRIVAPERLLIPHAATDEELGRAHAPEYLQDVLTQSACEQVRTLRCFVGQDLFDAWVVRKQRKRNA